MVFVCDVIMQKHEIKVLLWLHDKEPVKVYRRYWFNLQLLFICKERALKAQDISFYWREREKEEKKRKAIAKRFALQHGNAIMKLMLKNFNVDRKNISLDNKEKKLRRSWLWHYYFHLFYETEYHLYKFILLQTINK